MTSNAKQFHRYSLRFASMINWWKFWNYKKKKEKREIKTRGGRIDGIAISLQLGNYIRSGLLLISKLAPNSLPLSLSLIPPLFKTFLVYPREIVLLTQFPLTRFSVNRTGARVRNNSLPKWCSINKLPISFSISSNRSAFRFEGRGWNERYFPSFQDSLINRFIRL